jgi:lipopolysaccharide export system permease protein
MRKLDYYVNKNFFSTLIFTLVAFAAIFVIIDLIDKLSDFLSKAIPKQVMILYYVYYLPYIMVLILPVGILLSSLFSIGKLAHNNEIIAMKSSGISQFRILLPLYLIGLLISLFVIYFGEKIVPFTNQKMFDIEREHLGKHTQLKQRRSNLYFKDPKFKNWIYINHYDHLQKLANKVSLQTIDKNQIHYRIDVQQMAWMDDHWELRNGYERKISTTAIEPIYFETRRFDAISYLPEDFEKIQKKQEEMTYEELKKFIDEVARNGGEPQTWLVDLYLKVAFPFSNFILLLFGAPLAAGKPRSGKAFGFGISLFVAFFFFGFVKTGQTLGHSGVIHPLLAAWFGNLVFLVAGLVVNFKVK